jgi:hypothetical protein
MSARGTKISHFPAPEKCFVPLAPRAGERDFEKAASQKTSVVVEGCGGREGSARVGGGGVLGGVGELRAADAEGFILVRLLVGM